MWKRLYGTCVRLVEVLEHFHVTFSVNPTPDKILEGLAAKRVPPRGAKLGFGDICEAFYISSSPRCMLSQYKCSAHMYII